MSYLLDTCLLSELVKPAPNPAVLRWLQSAADQQLFISVITVAELRRGVLKLPPSRKRTQLSDWLDALMNQYGERILDFDLPTAERWATLTATATQQGNPLPLADSLIAATAAHHTLTLVTRNTADFAATNIPLHNPWH